MYILCPLRKFLKPAPDAPKKKREGGRGNLPRMRRAWWRLFLPTHFLDIVGLRLVFVKGGSSGGGCRGTPHPNFLAPPQKNSKMPYVIIIGFI